jgi:hypothetical protein
MEARPGRERTGGKGDGKAATERENTDDADYREDTLWTNIKMIQDQANGREWENEYRANKKQRKGIIQKMGGYVERGDAEKALRKAEA